MGAVVAWLAATHHAVASSVDERAAIVALNQAITDAIERRDVDAVMAGYADAADITFFEDTMPFELRGRRSIHKYMKIFLPAAAFTIDSNQDPFSSAVISRRLTTH
jgi:ketosteroid isomerase-like protein